MMESGRQSLCWWKINKTDIAISLPDGVHVTVNVLLAVSSVYYANVIAELGLSLIRYTPPFILLYLITI